jgi:uncharacterized protein (TIRG00374 family)
MNRSHVFTILKLALAALLIWYVIDKAGWENIRSSLANIDRTGWLIGLGLVILANCLSMYRWHLLMRSVGLNSSFFLALRLGFIGVFFSNIVPGLTGGDVVKAVYVTRENPGQRASAVMSVAVDRIIGIVALALIAAVVIPFDLERYGEAALGIYGFLGAAGFGAVCVLSRRAKSTLKKVFGALGRNRNGNGKKPGVLAKLEQAASIYRERLGMVALALGMSCVVHLLIITALFVLGTALADGGQLALESGLSGVSGSVTGDASGVEGADLFRMDAAAQIEVFRNVTYGSYCSVVPIIMIISALPVAPAGWGVGEMMFVYFFQTVMHHGGAGAELAQAAADRWASALSLTYRFTVLLVSLIGGLFLAVDRKRVMEAASHTDSPEQPGPEATDVRLSADA